MPYILYGDFVWARRIQWYRYIDIHGGFVWIQWYRYSGVDSRKAV